MPRAQFYADVRQAMSDPPNPNISNVYTGEEDGLVTFDYHRPDRPSRFISMEIFIPDTFTYRVSHHFYVYATSKSGVSVAVGLALERITKASAGLTIKELLCTVAMELDQLFSTAGVANVSELASTC
ncbi:MAG: hypothetical protein M1823_003143, partial [Watsoniomyces obsoletus]